jgi:hypothetical protein
MGKLKNQLLDAQEADYDLYVFYRDHAALDVLIQAGGGK